MNMRKFTLFLVMAMLTVVTALMATQGVQAGAQAVAGGKIGDYVGLCMCAMRRPSRPSPPPSSYRPPAPKPSNPQPSNNDNNDNEEEERPSQRPQPTPQSCTPAYAAPAFTSNSQYPPYPLTIGQDPGKEGVDLFYNVVGGAKTNNCDSGSARSPITAFQVISVELASESVAWINNELAEMYPGATVKGNYPFVPTYSVTGIGSATASLTAHIDPLDPGDYLVTVRARQGDGQVVSNVFRVKVWLFEATISGP